jgi:hypothetical protein
LVDGKEEDMGKTKREERKNACRRGRMDENEKEWIEEEKISELYSEYTYRWSAWLLTRSLEDLSVEVCSLSE